MWCRLPSRALSALRLPGSCPSRARVGACGPRVLGDFSHGARWRCSAAEQDEPEPREAMEYDVVIVGAGPAGLSSAIRLKQICEEQGTDLSVCVVEKAAEVGAHILSGNCFEPRAMDELLPEWREDEDLPQMTPVNQDKMYFLTETNAVPLPVIPQMNNHGNYILSLSQLVRYLGNKAEEMGVEIYPGFAASEVLYEDGAVVGVATGDMGVAKDGSHKDTHMRGMELRARQTLFAEGCRGSLTKQVVAQYDLDKDSQPQSYGLGVKEVWEIPPEKSQPGLVMHTVGWPLQSDTYGGSFLYHAEGNKVMIGFVVGLDYPNPYLSPYQEFQRYKTHPKVAEMLEGGTCVQYGARTINEGGLQSIPKLTFPGGALVGCSAGFVNVAKIKGTHTAMKSGMVAAENVHVALTADEAPLGGTEVVSYETDLKKSWAWDELNQVRNIRPAFHWGFWLGSMYAGLEAFLLKGRAPWTLSHPGPDHEQTKSADKCQPIEYPKPDGKLTFALLDNLTLSGTNHDHDSPVHLTLKDHTTPEEVNHPVYAAPESRFCPAKVYEYVTDEATSSPKLVINAQNCLHCKACDIKDPTQNIVWTVPEGGGGPAYTEM